MVVFGYTVAYNTTMVVKLLNAAVAIITVVASWRPPDVASCAIFLSVRHSFSDEGPCPRATLARLL